MFFLLFFNLANSESTEGYEEAMPISMSDVTIESNKTKIQTFENDLLLINYLKTFNFTKEEFDNAMKRRFYSNYTIKIRKLGKKDSISKKAILENIMIKITTTDEGFRVIQTNYKATLEFECYSSYIPPPKFTKKKTKLLQSPKMRARNPTDAELKRIVNKLNNFCKNQFEKIQ